MEVKKEYMPYMKDIFQALPQTFFLKDAEGKYAFASKICELVNGGTGRNADREKGQRHSVR